MYPTRVFALDRRASESRRRATSYDRGNAKLDIQREIEAGLAYAREALRSPSYESNQEARRIAALAFAALATLASTENRSSFDSSFFSETRDEPRVIDFERARANLAGTRRACVRVKVGRGVDDGAERPRLRVYRGETR